MDTHNIDNIIKQTIDNSGDFYTEKALESKLKIWNSIQKQKNAPKNKSLWLLIAASIVLLFCSGYLLVSQSEKTKTLSKVSEENLKLQNALKESIKLFDEQKIALNNLTKNSPDTVVVEKEILRYKTIVESVKIIDTLFVEKIVYAEINENNITEVNKPIEKEETWESPTEFSSTQIDYIQSTQQHAKQKKFKLSFGGNKENENSKNLAFSTEL